MIEWVRFIPLLFVFSGTANVLLIKWADKIESQGIDGVVRNFQHPFIQAGCMFFGQFLCFLIYEVVFKFLRRRRDNSDEVNILTLGSEDFSPKIFMVPMICDAVGSVLLLTGLYLTNASSFMMLRCAVIIFIGIFGVSYLNQTLNCAQWIGISVIAIGATLVTIRDYHANPFNSVLTGDLLILCSLVFHGLRHVQEEKYVKALNIPPLRAVGWQGIFGLMFLICLYVPLNFLKSGPPFNNNSRGVVEDFLDAMAQFGNNYLLVLAHGIFVTSVAIYNYCGLWITKETSGADRVSYNSLITVLVWYFAIMFQWERFQFVDFVIFGIILCGSWTFRNYYFVPLYRRLLGVYTRRRYGDSQSDPVTSQPADVI